MSYGMHDSQGAGYVSRRSETVGCEIVNPEGEVVAWTVDGYWGALVAALLNETETHGLVHPSPVTVEEPMDRESRK